MILIDKKLYSVQQKQPKQHTLEVTKTDENRQARQKIYNTEKWRKLRLQKLYDCPICEDCGQQMQEQVHHKDSFMNYTGWMRQQIQYDFNNLSALCQLCHQKHHRNYQVDYSSE